jgi:adenosylmethionine-8-amino-7-oxononanoate aminotransferase
MTSPIWHPYTRFSALQAEGLPNIVRGEGSWLVDDQGNRYFDGTSSWWCSNLGHNHPRIMEAIRRQTTQLDHSILGHLTHSGAHALAERLIALVGGPDSRVMFASDGSCAVEAGLKAAIQYWHNTGVRKKTRFAVLEHPYHGDTIGAVSVGFLDHFHGPFKPLTFPVISLPTPSAVASEAECLEAAQRILERHADELAALVVEPLVQGSAGMRFHSPHYLRTLASLCRRLNILLLVDEIAMGFHRTGPCFAFQQAYIEPDMVMVGKGLSGGALPISALVARKDVWSTFNDEVSDKTFYHGHTFGGNPLACAAALAALDVYDQERIAERVERVSALWSNAAPRFREISGCMDVRGLGFIWVVEMETDWSSHGAAFRKAMREKGVLVRPLGSTLYLMPPLNTPEEELSEVVDVFASVLARTN